MERESSAKPVAMPAIALALTSLAAAGIHFAVMPEHFSEAFVFGLFFAVVAWAQALWAVVVLVAPVRLVLIAGVVGNLAVIAIWAMSRTVGVPFGPHPWTREPVGPADLLCVALEEVIVVRCLVLARRHSVETASEQGRDGVLSTPALPALPAVLALTVALAAGTSVAIAAGPEHAHSEAEHSHGTEAHAHTASGHEGHALVGGNGEPDLDQIALIRHAMRKYSDVRVARAQGWDQEHRDWPSSAPTSPPLTGTGPTGPTAVCGSGNRST